MKKVNHKTSSKGNGKFKGIVLNFINRTFNSIQCAYMSLKERYRRQVTFKITGTKNGLLFGYFVVR